MAQMATAVGAMKFGPHHAVAAVGTGFHRPGIDIIEAGPARAAVVFGRRLEQFGAAAGALELAGPLFVVQGAGTRPLGGMLAQHAMLFGTQFTEFCLAHPVSFPPAYIGTIFRDWRR